MPNTRCAVPTCVNTNYKNQKHKFYSLPREHNRQKLWVQMIGRVDINTERDISKNYSVCDVHFHPLMIENGRLKTYALPIIRVSPDSLISSKYSVETQTCDSVNACYTQTDNLQLRDGNVQTDDFESFKKENDSADEIEIPQHCKKEPKSDPDSPGTSADEATLQDIEAEYSDRDQEAPLQMEIKIEEESIQDLRGRLGENVLLERKLRLAIIKRDRLLKLKTLNVKRLQTANRRLRKKLAEMTQTMKDYEEKRLATSGQSGSRKSVRRKIVRKKCQNKVQSWPKVFCRDSHMDSPTE